MAETRERSAIRLANQAAHLANALTGGPLHETATDVERAQLWDALEGWRKASGIPGDGWPIREDAVLRATPEIDVYWWCPECHEEVDSSRVTWQEIHDHCGTRVETRATPASDGGEVRERALDIVDFLDGSAPLAGRWFHERPAGAGPYWWRRYLAEIRAALATRSTEGGGE